MMTLSEYCSYDGLGLAALVRAGEVTPAELTQIALTGIERLNPQLGAVISVLREQPAAQIASGLPDGPFTGVPFLVKTLVAHAAGVPMEMGSRLAKGLALPHDTELVARFRRAGLVIVGTTTTPEFGYNATTESVLHGPTRNPWDLQRSSGGSSGGAGAVVSAGITPLAHANDGGGSIRVPASCCGLVGLKPTRGRTPTGPDYSDPLNGLGIEFALTRSVRDAAALLDAVAGPDAGAPHWAEPPVGSFAQASTQAPGRLRIAWMARPLSGVAVDPACVAALHDTVRLLESLGHELVEAAPVVDAEALFLATHRVWAANLTHWMQGLAAATGRQISEDTVESSSLACYRYGSRLTATELLQALDTHGAISRTVGQFFAQYDAVLSPTLARPALPLGVLDANAPGIDAEAWTRQVFEFTPFTSLYNTTGQPAISLPLSMSPDGLPIGMQLAGRFADEATLLRLAAQLEQARPWRDRRPPVHLASLGAAR